MAGWQTKPLGDVLTFQRGFDITKAQQQEGPYSVISSSGPKSTHNEFKVRGPGVIIGRKGTLGSVFYSEENYWPHDTTLWIKNFHGNHQRFAYYFLQTMRFERLDAGASNPSLNRNHIHTIPVLWPPLEEQRRIAGVLSAYDDLIENCQRRIQVLEKMARALYREWFIHFRYPGRSRETGNEPSPGSASHPLPKGEGMNDDILEGWETTTLGDLVKIRKGKNITKKTIRPGDIPVVAGGLTPAYFHDTANTEQPVITISASGANAGFVNMYYVDVWASDCSVIDSTATPYVYYFYLWLKHHQKEVTHLQRGAAQPHVYPKDLVRLESLDVPDDILKQFNKLVSPKFQLIKNLTLKIQNLRRTRDLLLPRLLAEQILLGGEHEHDIV